MKTADLPDGLFSPRCRCPRSPESDCTLALLAMDRPEEMLVSEPPPEDLISEVDIPFSDFRISLSRP